jgi:hypothetical protein
MASFSSKTLHENAELLKSYEVNTSIRTNSMMMCINVCANAFREQPPAGLAYVMRKPSLLMHASINAALELYSHRL